MMSLYHKEMVIGVIGDVVSPYVGDAVGRSAGGFFCNKLGLNGDRISAEEIERLLANLRRGLKVFLGETKALSVVDEVRGAIDAGRSA
jgi:hypothetical protein